MSEGALLGIGNPLLDISAAVPQEVLDRYGLKSGNATLAEPNHLPLYEELVKNYKVDYIAGGATQNAIRAAQWMLQKPNVTGYIGCIGKDKFGEELRSAANKDGVATHYLVDENTPTGTCAVLIRDKERSLVANLSAANNYKKEHFDSKEIQEIVHKASFFYSASFFLTVSPETSIALGKYASENNKTFAINLAAPFLIQFFWDGKMEEVLKYADIVFGNEDEAATLGTKLGWGSDLVTIATKLSEYPKIGSKKRLVVFTQGPNATITVQDGKVETFNPIPVPKEAIVDTNGAGDSFTGGFLAAYIQGKSLAESVASGHYCACVCIKQSGCTFPGKPDFKF
jgi:adenosine kinase